MNVSELNPVNIYAWRPYNFLLSEEQRLLQEKNLLKTGLYNGEKEICFIYTDYMEKMNHYLEDASAEIILCDTDVVLEDEVFHTSKIEGAKTTRIRTTEIHNGAALNKDNEKSERMIKNGFEAVKLLNLYGNHLDEVKLLSVWKTLVDGVCENESVRGDSYRIGDVIVGSYVPPKAECVPELVRNFLKFYNSPNLNQYPFLKAALLHCAFETIHPFPDGNGRLGRLLMNNYLIEQGIDSAKAISFSMIIDENRSRYDVAFVDSENELNDCTPFLEYMLSTMCTAYEKALLLQRQTLKR